MGGFCQRRACGAVATATARHGSWPRSSSDAPAPYVVPAALTPTPALTERRSPMRALRPMAVESPPVAEAAPEASGTGTVKRDGSWSVTPDTPLTEGSNSATATETDEAGNP